MAYVAVYLRSAAATPRLERVLLTAQCSSCLTYVAAQGEDWHLVSDPATRDPWFMDTGRPVREGPAFARLLRLAQCGVITAVLTWRLDRIEPDRYGTLPRLLALYDAGVRVISVREGECTEALGLLALIVRAAAPEAVRGALFPLAVAAAARGPG